MHSISSRTCWGPTTQGNWQWNLWRVARSGCGRVGLVGALAVSGRVQMFESQTSQSDSKASDSKAEPYTTHDCRPFDEDTLEGVSEVQYIPQWKACGNFICVI